MSRIPTFARARFYLIFAAGLMIASPAQARFGWLDPKAHPRVIFNADQSLDGYMNEHPEWFARDFVVISFFVKDVIYGEDELAAHTWGGVQNKLWHLGMNFGSYVSGTTAIPELSLARFPPDSVSIEDMSVKVHYLGPWMREPVQQVVDLGDDFSAGTLELGIANLWARTHALLRFIDNAAVHPRVARGQSWAMYCRNIKILRAISESQGTPAVFNVFARAWEMDEKETKTLIDAVAGGGGNAASFPLAWSRTLKDDKTANAWAVFRYRQMLDGGMVIILVPSPDADAYELSAWLATWRRPQDRVYIAAPYWEPPPF